MRFLRSCENLCLSRVFRSWFFIRGPFLATSRLLPLNEVIKQHIEKVLVRCAGQVEGRRGAARILQINPHTLRAKMRKLGIRWAEYRRDTDEVT